MATALTPSGRGLAVAVILSAAAHAGTLLIAGPPTEPVGGSGGGAGVSIQLAAAGGAPETQGPTQGTTRGASEGDEGKENVLEKAPEDHSAAEEPENAADAAETAAPRQSPKVTETSARRTTESPPAAEETASSRSETARPSREASREASAAEASSASRDAERVRPTTEQAASGGTGGSGEPEVDRGHLRAQARDALKGHFRYPPVAVRRGWEGEVRLAFRVTAEGEIRDIEVARGSGHRMLDDAAREALQRVARLKAPGHDVKLELPVHFRLREG
jgi:protein TonB